MVRYEPASEFPPHDHPAGSSRDKATRLLEKAEQTCFITNSLKAENTLLITIEGGE